MATMWAMTIACITMFAMVSARGIVLALYAMKRGVGGGCRVVRFAFSVMVLARYV